MLVVVLGHDVDGGADRNLLFHGRRSQRVARE